MKPGDQKEDNYCKVGNFDENFIFENSVKDIFVTLKVRDKGMIYLHQ